MNALRTIMIAGVARSGTSWLGQVFNSSPRTVFRFQPLFAYEFKGRVDEDSTRDDFETLFADMAAADTPFLTQRDKQESGEYPRFTKEAGADVLVFKENRYQSVLAAMMRRVPALTGIGITRNPCAVINSWRKNPREFPPGSDLMKEWRFANNKNKGNEDYFGFHRWKEVAHLHLDLQDRFPDRFRVVRYEDLVHDPRQRIPELFAFCGLPVEAQTLDFLHASTQSANDSYYAVFKPGSVADRWRKELDPRIVGEIEDELAGTRLERFIR